MWSAECGILMAALLVAVPAQAQVQVQIEPEQVRQGGIVFVDVTSREPLENPACQWLGRTYSLYPSNGTYRAALPIDRQQKIGPSELVVNNAAGEALARRTLSIAALDTGPIDIIRLTPDRMALQKDPRLEAESRRIGEIIRTRSAPQAWQGNFQLPVSARGHGYGKQRRYVERSRKGRKRAPSFTGYHRGLDFSLDPGTPVVAANAGRVLAAEPFVLPGNAVFIDHGQGIITSYFHLQEIRVKASALVAKGDVIGTVGSTGRSTGPHLHWSVYAQGQTVNPEAITRLPERFW